MNKSELQLTNESPHPCSHCTNGQQCPRCQAYERFPHWAPLQALFTSVMGVPHENQEPIVEHTEATRAITTFASLFASVGSTSMMVFLFSQAEMWIQILLTPAILASMLITSGMLRSMSMYMLHYATHGSFPRLNRFVGELSSMVSLSLSFDEYQEKHLGKHHPLLTSEEDPDQQTIAALGFFPGMPLAYYTKRLRTLTFSPHHFLLHLRGRLASQFSNRLSLWRRTLVATLHLTPLTLVLASSYALGTVVPMFAWLIAFLIPLTYGTYVSMLFFSLGLHRWFMEREPGMSAVEFYRSKTTGRFFGDPLPPKDLPVPKHYMALGLWWVRFLLVHLLIGKLFVMGASDNQQHDAHHRDPRNKNHQWYNSIYSRNRLALSATNDGTFADTWGSVMTTIVLNFERMSKMPYQAESLVEQDSENFLRTDM